MDRNSIFALFLLYRRRKRRRNRLHWVHPEIPPPPKKKIGAFDTLFGKLRDDVNRFFFIIFESLFRLSTRCIAVLKEGPSAS